MRYRTYTEYDNDGWTYAFALLYTVGLILNVFSEDWSGVFLNSSFLILFFFIGCLTKEERKIPYRNMSALEAIQILPKFQLGECIQGRYRILHIRVEDTGRKNDYGITEWEVKYHTENAGTVKEDFLLWVNRKKRII